MSEQKLSEENVQVVIFKLGNELYGINIFRVNEIIRIQEITPLPRAESYIRGLVNIRGKTIPVIDLRTKLMLPHSEDTDDSRIIILESEQGNVGIIVDNVKEVSTLKNDEIEEPPDMVSDSSKEYIWGVAKQDNNIITILDLDKALAS